MRRNSISLVIGLLLGYVMIARGQGAQYSSGTILTFGGTLPATCNVGELYAKNTATVGLYVCTSSNTWTAAGGGGITGGTCTNQAVTAISTSGVPTCTTLTSSYLSGIGVTASGLNQFASTTSAQLAGVLSDETGTGLAVFGTSPTLITPTIGAATATSIILSSDGSTSTPSIYWSSQEPNNTVGFYQVSSAIRVMAGDNISHVLGFATLGETRDAVIKFGGQFDASATADAGISRNAAGVIEINSGTKGTLRDIITRHILGGGTAPTVASTTSNSCGTTSPTIVGADIGGKVTVGATSGTSCTVTFGTAWTNAPSCWGNNETTANLMRSTSTTTTLVLAGTMVGGDVLSYGCHGY